MADFITFVEVLFALCLIVGLFYKGMIEPDCKLARWATVSLALSLGVVLVAFCI